MSGSWAWHRTILASGEGILDNAVPIPGRPVFTGSPRVLKNAPDLLREGVWRRYLGKESLHQFFSPVGTLACSQGRQPLDTGRRNAKAPEGRQELSGMLLPPLRGLRADDATFSRGSSPWKRATRSRIIAPVGATTPHAGAGHHRTPVAPPGLATESFGPRFQGLAPLATACRPSRDCLKNDRHVH